MIEYRDVIRAVFEANGMSDQLTGSCLDRFAVLAALLVETNAQFNLTAVTDPVGIAARHFADSVTLSPWIPKGASVIDVGCGAGFPALPLAIVRPDLHITALDSTAKKLAFIDAAVRELKLDGVDTLNMRAEEAGISERWRERYDAAVSRAVARLNVLAELCLPLVRVGGRMIAAKGSSAETEIDEARHGISLLGGEIAENVPVPVIVPPLAGVPGETLGHNLVIIQKKSPVPKIYPRNFARINKKPL